MFSNEIFWVLEKIALNKFVLGIGFFFQINQSFLLICMFFFCLTIFNSLQKVNKENTSSFEILIPRFLIVPFYLLKKCEL